MQYFCFVLQNVLLNGKVIVVYEGRAEKDCISCAVSGPKIF